MKNGRRIVSALCAALILSSCGGNIEEYAKERIYADYDVAKELGIKLSAANGQAYDESNPDSSSNTPSISRGDSDSVFRMKVYEKMDIYTDITAAAPSSTLADGTFVDLREMSGGEWAEIYDTDGNLLGYAKDGFSHTIDADTSLFAELPIEYGTAKTNADTLVSAYSHLVDIRKYMTVYSSVEESNEGVNLSMYDIKVSMKLSTDDTSINEPFYNSNICMIQYDILPKLKKAIEMFRRDGYIMVIYDAYRPTSVQQRWFDVVRVHKWVADPSIGMGGVHDRGTALDISLIDITSGKELEMPTPMHTFTEESARTSETMTKKARENMDYMMNVMVSCGFTYINSEWWHFQDADTEHYLPTDHPIDTIPLVPSEMIEKRPLTE